jgi:hypothetical protein
MLNDKQKGHLLMLCGALHDIREFMIPDHVKEKIQQVESSLALIAGEKPSITELWDIHLKEAK